MKSRFPLLPNRSRVDRCVLLRRQFVTVVVSIDFGGDVPLGLRVHHGERDASIRTLMARSTGTFIKSGRTCVFDREAEQEAGELADALRNRLFQIACKPLSQRQVQTILDITSRERLRWGKDGRLPQSGTVRIRKGACEISLWTYPTAAIEYLANNPAEIGQWRETDKAITAIGLNAVLV